MIITNEIFYRVALMRERWQARNPNKPKFPTGHFHVAWVQAKIINNALSPVNLSEKYAVYLNLIEKSKKESNRTIYDELAKLIKTVEKSITNSLTNFNDLF